MKTAGFGKVSPRTRLFVAAVLLNLLFFQNCSQFTPVTLLTNNGQLDDGTNPTPNPGTTPGTGTTKVFEAQTGELLPVELRLPMTLSSGPSTAQLPKGVIYDSFTKTLRWLPQKGQAGRYEIRFNSGIDTYIIRLNVTAVSPTDLKKGPYNIYKDGDVGYIFIHGAGDLDRCGSSGDLAKYWGRTPELLSPDTETRYVACYDGRNSVAQDARKVAEQILNEAKCGRFNKCILVTHSMGGLMVEHMFTHTRLADQRDPVPSMFASRDLYQKVKDRTLFVISLGSAAGGSKVANIAQNPRDYSIGQSFVAKLSSIIGEGNDDSTDNLRVNYASTVVAPMNEDPGVPFFMVPGYSPEHLDKGLPLVFDLLDQLIGDDDADSIFNGSFELAFLDRVASFRSSSDGLVDFRSACGIASANENDGPGQSDSTDNESSFQYCVQAPKKPNHYVWFAINLNHYLLTVTTSRCTNKNNPCVVKMPNATGTTMTPVGALARLSAVEVIRKLLTDGASTVKQGPVTVEFRPQTLAESERDLASKTTPRADLDPQ